MEKPRRTKRRLQPGWWAAIMVAGVSVFVLVCWASFAGTFRSFVPVTLISERAGLVMESGAKVKMRGVQVGRVAGIEGGNEPVSLKLDLYPDQIGHIPANVQAQIRATTAFGAKYVDLIYPDHPSREHLAAGAVLRSRNVSTEVQTVFQNLVDVLHQIDPPKLNAVLTALADGVRGQGDRIGEATTDANQVLLAINPRMGTIREDWRSFNRFNETYSAAAQNILTILDSATTVGGTITNQAKDLDALLLANVGFSRAGVNLLGSTHDNLIQTINVLEPTTNLLMKYNPEYTCMLVGAKWFLDNGGYRAMGGNGRTVILDSGLLYGQDPYRYPDNLPIVAAKGGPGGKPSCGSLPDVTKNFPVRQLITNTGWGTGVDIRPNLGIGFPGWLNYLTVTKGVPLPPIIRNPAPAGPAPGPIPYPGAPAYGAPLYGPDGTPLYPPPPGPPPQAPAPPAASPPSQPPVPSP